MKRTILYPLLTLYLLIFSNGQAIASGNDSIRLSLLTCAPGEEIYSLFGHTAIRYEDPANGIDAVFNYGLFSFNTPNFILRFSLGETDYQLGATDYARFAGGICLRRAQRLATDTQPEQRRKSGTHPTTARKLSSRKQSLPV